MADATSTTDTHIPAAATAGEPGPSPRWPSRHPDEVHALMRDSAVTDIFRSAAIIDRALDELNARSQRLELPPMEYVKGEVESLRTIIQCDRDGWFTREHVVSCLDHILRQIDIRQRAIEAVADVGRAVQG